MEDNKYNKYIVPALLFALTTIWWAIYPPTAGLSSPTQGSIKHITNTKLVDSHIDSLRCKLEAAQDRLSFKLEHIKKQQDTLEAQQSQIFDIEYKYITEFVLPGYTRK